MKKALMKTVKAQNTTLRQLTIHGLSGKTWHLPPAYTAEIPQNEIIRNTMVEKLVQKRCLVIHTGEQKAGEKEKSTKRVRQTAGKKQPAKGKRTVSNTKKKASGSAK
jgi:hypothetical protein